MKPALVVDAEQVLPAREQHVVRLVHGGDGPPRTLVPSVLFPAWQAQPSPEGDACSGYGVPALGACVTRLHHLLPR